MISILPFQVWYLFANMESPEWVMKAFAFSRSNVTQDGQSTLLFQSSFFMLVGFDVGVWIVLLHAERIPWRIINHSRFLYALRLNWTLGYLYMFLTPDGDCSVQIGIGFKLRSKQHMSVFLYDFTRHTTNAPHRYHQPPLLASCFSSQVDHSICYEAQSSQGCYTHYELEYLWAWWHCYQLQLPALKSQEKWQFFYYTQLFSLTSRIS